jgi:hypothetical protein
LQITPSMTIKPALLTLFLALVLHLPLNAFSQASGAESVPEQPSVAAPPSSAPTGTAQPTAEMPQKTDAPESAPGFFDRMHSELSSTILGSAEWLDSFFADERALKEENRTYVRLSYDAFYEEKSAEQYLPAADLRLVLPQLQNKTHLVFSSEPRANPSLNPVPTNVAGGETTTPAERQYNAAIHYIFRSTVDESILMRVGTSLSLKSPALFVAPRYRALIPLKSWNLRFTQEATYRTDTRWQTNTQVDFERPLSSELFFRANADGIWTEASHGYAYGLNFYLRQTLGPTHALQYAWTNSYQTRPIDELSEIAVRIAYRHSFWRDWMFFEVAPQARFPRSRNFKLTPGILFRLEMFFGVTP